MSLTGAINFRDLGGYKTKDGRVTAWGRLFRSDSLAELTENDAALVSALGLRRIFDLRTAGERLAKPSRMPASAAATRHEVGFYLNRTRDLLDFLNQNKLSADEVISFMTDIYRQAPIEDIHYFRNGLELFLGSEEFPALIHCTSGKDRTGIFVMIILCLVGVPRETIVHDYLITNDYRKDVSFMFDAGADRTALDAVRSARREFIAAAFETIDNFWGGEDLFLHKGLGVTTARRDRLKKQLLEPE